MKNKKFFLNKKMLFIFICNDKQLVLKNEEIRDMELKFNYTIISNKYIDIGNQLYNCYRDNIDTHLEVNEELFYVFEQLNNYTLEQVRSICGR